MSDTLEPDDLDLALAGYKEAIIIDDPTKTSDPPTSTEQPINDGANEDWRGNPLYYQTGKKQGQLRKGNERKLPPKETMELSGTLIDGAMFIMLTNMLIPMLIVFANNSLTDKKIKVDDLSMTEQQKRDLTPISNEVVKYLSLKANPVILFLIANVGIYGINFMAAKAKVK